MSNSVDFSTTLAHHDAAIQHLGGRITGVESGLRTLQSEVHTGFSSIQTAMAQQIGGLASKLDKLDAVPKFNFHQTVKTVSSLVFMFAAICAGIIYITNSQNAANLAEQKTLNAQRALVIEDLATRVRALEAWRPVITKKD